MAFCREQREMLESSQLIGVLREDKFHRREENLRILSQVIGCKDMNVNLHGNRKRFSECQFHKGVWTSKFREAKKSLTFERMPHEPR